MTQHESESIITFIGQTAIDIAVCDRGYRGVSAVDGVTIMLPKKALKRDNRYQRDKKRQRCRQERPLSH